MNLVVPSPCETEPYNNSKYSTGCANSAYNLFSEMDSDLLFFFYYRPLLLLVFSILTKKKPEKCTREVPNFDSAFVLSVTEVFVECGWVRLTFVLFQGLFYVKDGTFSKLSHKGHVGNEYNSTHLIQCGRASAAIVCFIYISLRSCKSIQVSDYSQLADYTVR